jgi:CBS domain-containing protein
MSRDLFQRRVKHVMSKVVITADAQDTLHEALVLMHENRLATLPVVDQRERCVGIISASDLVELASQLEQEISDLGKVSEISRQWLVDRLTQHDLGQQKLAERMTAAVMSIDAEATLSVAAAEMLRHRVHHLPVLDEHGKLRGILSTMDILNAFVEAASD